jgi:predicted adenylyl cyclase CyaB
MGKNIEIKARLKNWDQAMALHKDQAEGPELLMQEDTFFPAGAGRLKLRRLTNGEGELIHYERPDTKAPSLSRYDIVTTQDPNGLRKLLGAALGNGGIIRKARHLFTVGPTRFHLDEVETLGRFLELEVVLDDAQDEDEAIAEATAIANEWLERLGVDEADLIEEAYVDLLSKLSTERRRSPSRGRAGEKDRREKPEPGDKGRNGRVEGETNKNGSSGDVEDRLVAVNQALQIQALNDPLTGIFNRRAILERLDVELDRARREDQLLSVAVADIDLFKQVNDTYGHAAGDAVLRQLVERLGAALRSYDTLGRIGGEEFMVILPGAPRAEVHVVPERLRSAVERAPMHFDELEIPVTISIGVATAMYADIRRDVLVRLADDALYLAKRNGRNRVEYA